MTATAALLVACICGTVRAGEPISSVPLPRVESGGHAGYIKKLSVDRAGSMMLTVSDDKTARLWETRTGRLLRVLRVPIRNGHEGQLYAGALSPDGRIAAVAGYTGSDIEGSVYFFDTNTGKLAVRLSHLADVAIDNLAFSDDGKFLAVCFGDGRGVQIFDLQRQALLARHDELKDKILGADFNSSGDFALTTIDGTVRRFKHSEQFKTASMQSSTGRTPMHLQFSPDGSEFAIGYDGQPGFSILDSESLREKYAFTLPSSSGQRGLHVVEWASDGQYLYAGGEMQAGIDAPIYRFGQRGRGPGERVITSLRRISDMRRLPNGAMAFSSGAPEVGIIESTGRVRWRYRSPNIDFRPFADRFRLSRSADVVSFATSSGARAVVFSVLEPVESALRQTDAPLAQTAPAQSDAASWRVVISDDRERMTVNEQPVVLEHRESVNNWAGLPDGSGLIVGTSWSLRMLDRQVRPRWAVALSAAVNLTAVSGDGKNVVVALSDGTLRWYRAEDGTEILALFVHRNGQDWIAWIPSGYYMSSVSGDNYIGWHVNRGADRDPDFYRAIQFERVLYRPDIVQAHFRSRGAARMTPNATGFDIAQLDTIAPPRLQLSVLPAAKDQRPGTVMIEVSGESLNLPMQEWSLFVNGIPATPARERPLPDAEARAFTRRASLDLTSRTNRVRVESSNGRALGFAEIDVDVPQSISGAKGDLYVAAIGVGAFDDPKIPRLSFAAQDAAEVIKAFTDQNVAGGFGSVKTWMREDASQPATSKALAELPAFLASANGNDTVILFLASHGLSDPEGSYYFVPRDGRKADIDRALEGGQAPSLVRWDFFVNALSRAAGRRLLIVDTCSSAAIGAGFDAHSLAKRSMSSSFALVAAARGNEESQEYANARHGLFTYGLLDALKTGFDPNADGKVSLSEAFEHAFETVQTLRNRARGPQTPQLAAPDVLADMQLSRAHTVRTASRN